MRSYGQYCAVARALDVIGDRWSLLIVRELLLHDGARYTDLRKGLPGIATNLLADRLRDLEEAGVVEREDAPPPVATTLFRLTERGRSLQPVLRALLAWGAPLLTDGQRGDEFRSYWLKFPLEAQLTDHAPDQPPVAIQVQTADEPMVVETVDGAVRARPGVVDDADLTLSGPPDIVLGVLMGALEPKAAKKRGLEYAGDPAVLRRLLR
jgi:DNA-binding HxlR family transcriptional regulator